MEQEVGSMAERLLEVVSSWLEELEELLGALRRIGAVELRVRPLGRGHSD
jgi:hypothetical protein